MKDFLAKFCVIGALFSVFLMVCWHIAVTGSAKKRAEQLEEQAVVSKVIVIEGVEYVYVTGPAGTAICPKVKSDQRFEFAQPTPIIAPPMHHEIRPQTD